MPVLTVGMMPANLQVRTGALVRFGSVGDAARAVIKIVQAGPKALCRCELLNADGIDATNKMYKTDLGESCGLCSWLTVHGVHT